jgi:hypothetical protein
MRPRVPVPKNRNNTTTKPTAYESQNQEKNTIATTHTDDETREKRTKTFMHGQHTLRSYSDRCVPELSVSGG